MSVYQGHGTERADQLLQSQPLWIYFLAERIAYQKPNPLQASREQAALHPPFFFFEDFQDPIKVTQNYPILLRKCHHIIQKLNYNP